MRSILSDRANVTNSGVSIVRTKEDLKQLLYLAPGVDQAEPMPRPRPATKAPSRIQFGMVRDRRLRITAAIPVELQRSGKTVVAKWEEIDEFGYGKNISEALDDFGKTVEELFLSLHDRRATLTADLDRILQILSAHIQLRHNG